MEVSEPKKGKGLGLEGERRPQVLVEWCPAKSGHSRVTRQVEREQQ